MKKHNCPICRIELTFNARYPNYICSECSEKATDITGRKLAFANKSIGGGFEAIYLDNNEVYDNHICYVNGIECYANEARFGGIVVEKIHTMPNRGELPLEEIVTPEVDSGIETAWKIIKKKRNE
jgi:hypothetical protein